MTAAAALTSDHVNLMILRYLEEHGHENTANAFWRDWHRPQQYDNPEHFPFATDVQRNELVAVIQQGLAYDDYQAQVRKVDRRFRWTEKKAGPIGENGTLDGGVASRPVSSGRYRDKLASSRVRAEPTGPSNKTVRRGDTHEAHINGSRDLMDIDRSSPSADVDEDGDRGSTTLASEVDISEAPERYDSMDVAIQTEPKVTPMPIASHWTLNGAKATIFTSLWNPLIGSPHSRTMLLAGDSVCRFSQIPGPADPEAEILHFDVTDHLTQDFFIADAAWRTDGLGAAVAACGIIDLDGQKSGSWTLTEHGRTPHESAIELRVPMIARSGLVTVVKYSPGSNFLVAAHLTDGKHDLHVWKTSGTSWASRPPCLDAITSQGFDKQISEVEWLSDDTLLLVFDESGDTCLLQLETSEEPDAVKLVLREIVTSSNTSSEQVNGEHSPKTAGLDRITVDRFRRLIALTNIEQEQTQLVLRTLPEVTKNEWHDLHSLNISGPLSAFSFQPASTSLEQASSYLAVACSTRGACNVYTITLPGESEEPSDETDFSLLTTLTLSEGPAHALAWSPDGQYIALGNAGIVEIWRLDAWPSRSNYGADPLIGWKITSEMDEEQKGRLANTQAAPRLSWSADGEMVSFTIEDHVAIMHFQSTLALIPTGPNDHSTP